MSKNNKKFKLPKRSPLLYLLLILVPVVLFFAIMLPISYAKTYKANKLYPFKSYAYEEVKHEHEEGEEHDPNEEIKYQLKENVVTGGKDAIKDFDMFLYCDEYNDGSSAKFNVFALKNENSTKYNIAEFTIRLGFAYSVLGANDTWTPAYKESSSRTVKLVDKAKDAIKKDGTPNSSQSNPSISISGIIDLPAKSPLLFETYKTLPLYAYITYKVKENGETITKEYLLKFKYDEYMIDKTVFDADTEDEVFAKPSAGGVLK